MEGGEMTDEQINIAIAKSLGIKVVPCTCSVSPWRCAETRKHIPNYTADLNACHEAVNSLSGGQYVNWVFALEEICGMPTGYNATARQRCEAYLKTIGKWIE
jgi:hypothetical protein